MEFKSVKIAVFLSKYEEEEKKERNHNQTYTSFTLWQPHFGFRLVVHFCNASGFIQLFDVSTSNVINIKWVYKIKTLGYP